MMKKQNVLLVCLMGTGVACAWDMGEPMTTYWAGPGYPYNPQKLTESAARQIKAAGFNTAWGSSVEELDVASKIGLRVIYNLDVYHYRFGDESRNRFLAGQVAAIRKHPALYMYYLNDEPDAGQFTAIAKGRELFHKWDPDHPAWVNLLPTYASNRQLGVEGEIIRAYREHVRLFGEIVRPEVLSHDHYQLCNNGDTGNYLLNLGIIRESAAAQRIPFFNMVQACTWRPGKLASPSSPRVPEPEALRYLVYSTLAYGAEGVIYYVYSHPKHVGSIVGEDGVPGPLYAEVSEVNRAFVSIAKELRKVRFVGAYLHGLHAPGTTPYCETALLRISPETPQAELDVKNRQELTDTILVSRFEGTGRSTHLMVVNMDYRKDRSLLVGVPSGSLQRFEVKDGGGAWTPLPKSGSLDLRKGEGVLLRLSDGK